MGFPDSSDPYTIRQFTSSEEVEEFLVAVLYMWALPSLNPYNHPDYDNEEENLLGSIKRVKINKWATEMDVPSVEFFRSALQEERTSLLDLSTHWLHVHDTHPNIPDDVNGQILAVTGKAKLLVNQRLAQFSQLLEACENQTGTHKTTCMDLQGFWEMVHFQVDELHRSFDALEKLKNNNWEERLDVYRKQQSRLPLRSVGNTPPQSARSKKT